MPQRDWKDKTVEVITWLGRIATIFSASIGCYGFWLGWHTYNYQQQIDLVMVLISFWMIIFGIIGVMAECKADMWRQLGFLASRFGRGCFYLFVGSLSLVEGMQISCIGFYDTKACTTVETEQTKIDREKLHFTSGIVSIIVAFLLFGSYALVKSGSAGRYRY